MPIIILAGDEEFEISRRVADLKNSLLDPDWSSMNFACLDNPQLPEIIDAAATLPFGPGNRLVLIDKCALFTKRRTKAGTADDTNSEATKSKSSRKDKNDRIVEPEAFATALSSVYEKTFLLFACPYNFDSTLKLSKAISKIADIEAFSKEKYFPGSKNAKLEDWCRKEAKRCGCTIDTDAIEYLLEGSEANLRQLSSEIGKASVAILPETRITYELVSRLSPHYSHIFAFADCWLNNRLPEALLSLKEIMSQQSALPALAALQTMLSKWIKMKLLSEDFNQAANSGKYHKEISIAEMAKKVAFELKMIPFVVEKDLKRLAKQSSDKLIDKRIQLCQLEFLIKSGQMPEKHALEIFVLK